MMKIIQKDITTVESPAIIIHGVNCQQSMGSGVARALYTKYPNVKNNYLHYNKSEVYLGKIQVIDISDKLHVINCWTQDFYGSNGNVYASPDAIRDCLEKVVNFCRHAQIYDVYSPKIGCGLGGLDWDRDVKPLFEDIETKNLDINFTICEI